MLNAFSVPGYNDRLYILGSFARRVTFYSQQVRALNLVDALCDSGRVTSRGEVAVIGAGVAGMTAAAGLIRRGARVCIFEKDADPAKKEGRMPLQQGSGQRVVNPHIYDWPAPGALEPQTTNALLDWSSDTAKKVVLKIGEKFEEIVAEGDNRQRLRFVEAKDITIERGTAAVVAGGARQTFDIVILAVGFGVEGETTGWHSYWTDDNIESVKAKGTWLISGCGDGALTDLMRLAITGFDHKGFLEDFSQAIRAEDKKELADADREGRPPEELVRLYKRVAATVKCVEVRDNVIWLNCAEEDLYLPRASILNRLIAAYLLQYPKINIVPNPAKLNGAPEKTEKGFVVTPDVMGGEAPFPFTGVITRHGPARAVEHDFPNVWADAKAQFDEWQAFSPATDWTRTPLWRDGAFKPGEMVPLPPDVTQKTRCLVIVSTAAEGETVVQSVEQALRRSITDPLPPGTRPLDPEPIVIAVEQVLADPAWYAYAVRALCACQLAVFDVTDSRPATALLLGIRAAVRRGVTVTVVRDALDAASWTRLPFNIREVGVVSDISKENAFIENVRSALMNGIELLASIGESYRDLPVYDAVRRLGTEPGFFVPVPPTKRVLLLSWYAPNYVDTSVGQRVELSLGTAFKERGHAAPPVLRIIDTASPQLVSDKLYAEIRRDRYCVADWTGWRFNVFFELGVRLAVSPDEPVNVICGDAAWLTASKVEVPAERNQEKALRELLGPYKFTKNIKDFTAHLGACLEAFLDANTPWPADEPRIIPLHYTNELVVSAIELAYEPWGTPVWKRLQTTAKEILGPAEDKTNAVSPLLFRDRDRGKRHERAGVDHLVASWLFVEDRVQHGGADLEEEQARLAEKLYSVLENLGLLEQPEYEHIARRLERFLP